MSVISKTPVDAPVRPNVGLIAAEMNGALLVNKPKGISSFGVIESLQRTWLDQVGPGSKRKDIPKMGHGGTLDPFATGTLVVLCGRAVKLARYFLGATKSYEGVIRFGQTTVPGDPTAPISETSDVLPESLEQLQLLTKNFTSQPYMQTPPMHSAKKLNGRPLYELARAGIEVERKAKLCSIYEFEILSYEAPHATFRLKCGSGTYVRTLVQDLAKLIGSVAMLDSLHRTSSGVFHSDQSFTLEQIAESGTQGKWNTLSCWVEFDRLLDGYPRVDAEAFERDALRQGKQNVLFNILKRAQAPLEKSAEQDECLAIYHNDALVSIARRFEDGWGIERVFSSGIVPQSRP